MLNYLREWYKLKYKKIIITACVLTTVIIAAVSLDLGSILMRLAGHSMSNSEHSSTSHNTHEPESKSPILNNLEISNTASTAVSANEVPNINTPPKKKDPDLTNVAFIDYTVNPADTLWKITRNYMPNYPAQDTENTIGIITYIAEKNYLQKGPDGNYVIYYGQKLKIPAQLSIVSNVIKKTTDKAATTSGKKVSTSTSSNSSVTNNSSSTPSKATINTSSSSNSTETIPSPQIEHSSHSSH